MLKVTVHQEETVTPTFSITGLTLTQARALRVVCGNEYIAIKGLKGTIKNHGMTVDAVARALDEIWRTLYQVVEYPTA